MSLVDNYPPADATQARLLPHVAAASLVVASPSITCCHSARAILSDIPHSSLHGVSTVKQSPECWRNHARKDEHGRVRHQPTGIAGEPLHAGQSCPQAGARRARALDEAGRRSQMTGLRPAGFPVRRRQEPIQSKCVHTLSRASTSGCAIQKSLRAIHLIRSSPIWAGVRRQDDGGLKRRLCCRRRCFIRPCRPRHRHRCRAQVFTRAHCMHREDSV